jgi:hypothetical protein
MGGGAMIDSGVVDVVLGVIFIFLVFSLVVSGINEAITRAVGWRSRHLWRALRQMLDGERAELIQDERPDVKRLNAMAEQEAPSPPSLTTGLYMHPLIRQLEGRLPGPMKRSRISHIASSDFSRALIDLLVPTGEGQTSVAQVRENVRGLPVTSPLRAPVLALISEAGDRLDHLQKGISEWFDARMEAVGRAYKRHTKWVLLGVGLVVVLIFNVDALGAADRLYRDEALRGAVAQQAVSVVERCEGQPDIPACTREQVDRVDAAIRLPVGWPDPDGVDIWQVLGWIIAAAALAQGAPFWFDVLRRASRLRTSSS